MSKKYLIPIALMLMIVLAACGGQQTAEPAAVSQPAIDSAADSSMDKMESDDQEAMTDSSDMDDSHDDGMDNDGMDDNHDDDMNDDAIDKVEGDHKEAMDDSDMAMDGEDQATETAQETMMEQPLWQTLAITNAATGEPLTLGDFKGQTVFVEPMATWCSNCRAQQGEVQQAKAQLGDDVVFVGLSLETTLPAADLAGYAQANGFDWTYAVMSEELLTGLVGEFGRSITSAPSTPHFIIRPDGSFSELSTGIHSAEEIISQIQEAQS